jgi:pimeloyl-ACP methyl ester carboxylesterase
MARSAGGAKKVKRRRSPPKPPPQSGNEPAYSPALQAAAQALTTRVQEMHAAISDKTFHAVQAVPGLSAPASLVQRAHDAITSGVYAAVRGGATAVMRLAAEAERHFKHAERPPAAHELTLRSALNAAAGDGFAEAGSPLAVPMVLLAQGQVLDEATRPEVWAGVGPRVVLFIHGLACDERSWQLFAQAWSGPDEPDADEPEAPPHYGALLEREFSITPLYLRYNTGLSIVDNAAGLAAQLDLLAAMAPQAREIVLVDHSMGGLVARLACDQSVDAAWAARVRCVVCLGSPLRGAPLEKLGHFMSVALGVSEVTRPLQTLANGRSQGVKDLRRGLAVLTRPRPPLRLVAGSLTQESTAGGSAVRRVLGDGLVTTRSALDARETGDVERAELPGLGHMALLNHPRVYALLCQWLADARSG